LLDGEFRVRTDRNMTSQPVEASTEAAAPSLPGGRAAIDNTLRTARHAIGLALGSVAVVLTLVALERTWFLESHQRAALRVSTAEQMASTLLLADERLTMSAQMAAATGEERWIARYHTHLPEVEAALATGESPCAVGGGPALSRADPHRQREHGVAGDLGTGSHRRRRSGRGAPDPRWRPLPPGQGAP
jgi:hypothetical protein